MIVYHGTTAAFDTFECNAPTASGSMTSGLGLFFSASAAIAAHFTLKPEVVDAGYDSAAGSRSLLDQPGRFDPAPFLPQARVIEAEVTLTHPYRMTAVSWMDWVEVVHGEWEDRAALVNAFRASLEADGHDGLIVEAWDGVSQSTLGLLPSVETDALTVVAFAASAVQVRSSVPAMTHLPPWRNLRPKVAPPAGRPARRR